jgi:hypothetical protein
VSDYVTLLGAETVQHAASSMSASAETMRSAASTIYDSNFRLSQILDEYVTRFERAVEQLIAALPPTSSQTPSASSSAVAESASISNSATPPEANSVEGQPLADGEPVSAQGLPAHLMCGFVKSDLSRCGLTKERLAGSRDFTPTAVHARCPLTTDDIGWCGTDTCHAFVPPVAEVKPPCVQTKNRYRFPLPQGFDCDTYDDTDTDDYHALPTACAGMPEFCWHHEYLAASMHANASTDFCNLNLGDVPEVSA